MTVWNVRFPGVIVLVEKHFLVSLQDLSLDILQLLVFSVAFSLSMVLPVSIGEMSMKSIFLDYEHVWSGITCCWIERHAKSVQF